MNRINTEVYDDSQNCTSRAQLSHQDVLDRIAACQYDTSFQFSKDDRSKSITITSVDDELNEGDGMLRVDVTAPSGYRNFNGSAWTRIVDNDVPHLRYWVDKHEVVEGESVAWTLLRDNYFETKLTARLSYEFLHRYPPPQENYGFSGHANRYAY